MAKTAAVAALVEVASGGRPGAVLVVDAPRDATARTCRGFSGNSHRLGAGRRRVRRRKESHLYPATTRSTERDPRQTWEENLARARSSGRSAAGVSAAALPRRALVAQALGPCAGSLGAHTNASGPPAQFEFPAVRLKTSLTFLEDVDIAETLVLSDGNRRPEMSYEGPLRG